MGYHVWHAFQASEVPTWGDWGSEDADGPADAARRFVDALIGNGELGHGDTIYVHVRDHGAWRFTIESVVRVAKTEKVR